MPALLTLSGVVVGYGGGDVLRGVDLSVEEHSLVCIVGPNGAGKSTVLRAISGLLRPRCGRITFRGRPITDLGPRTILELGIVQVAQDRTLFPNMTVGENILMGGYTIRDQGLRNRRVAAVCDQFALVRERWKDKAGALSGGQQRLVEFARALMLDPSVLLLDEPLTGLEPKTYHLVVDMITMMHRAGRTIVLVEQNARTGLGIASHGVVMENGCVRLQGSGPEVLGNPEVARLYLGMS
jgi:branched-chain amino acid transport system ATP-binding protein